MITPDSNNLRSLRAFFQAYPHLRSSELALLAGVPLRRIQRWRKRCGLTSRGSGWGSDHEERPFATKAPPRVIVEPVLDPSIWENKEWFEEQNKKGYGRFILARLTGRSPTYIITCLRRYGIQPQQRCSRNPCCNKQWLEEHYEIHGLSLAKCAAIAGVSRYTIYHWLVKFGFHIRDRYEAQIA